MALALPWCNRGLMGVASVGMGGVCFPEDDFGAVCASRKTLFGGGCVSWRTPSGGRAMLHGGRFRVGRRGEGEAHAAHTLNPVLLPTTCVVVNKPPALKHFPTIGLRPTVRKSFTRTAKSPQ